MTALTNNRASPTSTGALLNLARLSLLVAGGAPSRRRTRSWPTGAGLNPTGHFLRLAFLSRIFVQALCLVISVGTNDFIGGTVSNFFVNYELVLFISPWISFLCFRLILTLLLAPGFNW
jgi:hypothetical protein